MGCTGKMPRVAGIFPHARATCPACREILPRQTTTPSLDDSECQLPRQESHRVVVVARASPRGVLRNPALAHSVLAVACAGTTRFFFRLPCAAPESPSQPRMCLIKSHLPPHAGKGC